MAASIFEKTVGELAVLLNEAGIDHAAFEMPLAVCELAKCRATCCHDGVILSEEEAGILGREGAGIKEESEGRWRTETVVASDEETAEGFPAHFPKTRCVFLDEEHRCQWQLRSVAEGRHPWFYKPVSCWMHPLVLKARDGRPVLTLVSRPEDQGEFASFTPCGRSDDDGVAAREALKAELEMLEGISGRDFYGELNAPPGFSCAKEESSG